MSEWQDIRTAPKDGTPIRIKASYGLGEMGGCWKSRNGRLAFAEIAGRNVDPTHWKPAPPAEGDTG